jgi:ABC-type transporter Mla subunit MlaD
VEASVKGDGGAIRRLSKSTHEVRQKIDTLFDELETLTDELGRRSREFEEKIEELKAAGG